MKLSSLLAWTLICFVVLANHPLAAQTADDANKAKLEQRDQLWKQAVQVANEGKFPEAKALFEQVYALQESILGTEHVELLQTLDVIARVAEAIHDDTAVIDIRKRQHRISEQLYGKTDYRTQDATRAITDTEHNATRSPEDITRLQQATALANAAVKRAHEGDPAGAIALAEQAVEIDKQLLGEQHPDYATSLSNLAEIYKSMGNYSRAEPLYSQAIEIKKQVLGEQHPDYAISLNNLAGLYYAMGDYARAEPLFTQAMEINKQVLGEQHPDYAYGLNNLATLYKSMGDYARAEPLYTQAMEIQKQVLGEQHPDYAISLNNLAALYESMGDYARADPLFTQALEIRKQVFGEQHPDYADSLNNLASLYRSMGDYARAEPLHTQAMEIRKQVLGEQHPTYADSLNNLAYLYRSMGDYARAEPLYTQAMEIRKQVLGEQHPDYAGSLIHLAILYRLMGDYARAEPLFAQSMEINKQVLGEQHPAYAASLDGLAGLYESMGDHARAEPLFIQAIETRKQMLGEQHPRYASSLDHLAGLYLSIGDYARAEPLYTQAMEISKAVLGEQHPEYAYSLNNLAALYYSMGDCARAEPLFIKALEIQKQLFGEQHPAYAGFLNNLALLYFSMGDYPRAEPLFRQAAEINLGSLESTADVQSQRQQVSMGESLRNTLDTYLSLAIAEPKFQEAAYAALLRWKGSVWQRQQRQRLLIDQPELKSQFTALQGVASKLSALILNPPDPKQRETWHRQLDQLTDEREKLERDLSFASAAFREAKTPVTPEQLRDSLPEGTMLVDFLEFKHFTPANQEQQTKLSHERRLLVHLVCADEAVRAIDLGDVKSLNALVQTWRKDLGQSPHAARELRKRIWQPLEEHLDDITTVFVSPDGILGQFPLAALPGKQPGSYLLEDFSIVMLPIPQGLPAMASTTAPSTETTADRFCLVGGVDYEQLTAPDAPASPTKPALPSGPSMLAARGGQWQAFGALPGTAAEIDTIESLIRRHKESTVTTILRGGLASESAFSHNAPGNRYLHIATHGFFAPETVQNAMTARSESPDRMLGDSESRGPKLVGQHPDLLSGLVFAGANQKPEAGTDDGIITAAEVQSLDLRGVDLAVLSACETGLGKTAGGEGIIGLQRAFQLAGARTTITSLWKVDDAATQALMVEFYRNLFELKLSKLESLRQAQLWLLNNPEAIAGRDLTTRGVERETKITADTKTAVDKPTRSLPAYWAAFQLSGDPR